MGKWRQGAHRKMKKRLAGILLFSNMALATQMSGFGAQYYESDKQPSVQEYETQKDLMPEIIIGEELYTLERSRLSDISRSTGVEVNHGEQAAWLCLRARNLNYWFISNNEMGHGALTAIGIAGDGEQKECVAWSGDVGVRVKGWPLLSMPPERIDGVNTGNARAVQYCEDSPLGGEYIQLNCLQYHLVDKKISGVFLFQVTSS